ncbi:hypothetical protein O0I10_006496 [Lichtheimia ornata]|uniref:Uncharacterized protein n=1 Tax=Lichtheimia ornata TaxID=688661 RepID=A0AAD7XYM1_9FUNG|nr:uncharacterized protein O0I10_006496 [Lichtheimia ornata]KAJ8657681.1 hypothetical protein O0I10_006496 [Lichtheimia ornata]
MQIPSGQLVLRLTEIRDDPQAFANKSVRLKGILKTFDPGANFATIEYDDYQLEIDTALLDPFSFPIGTMIEFIGELQSNEAKLILRPRVARSMDTLDLELYEKAAQYKRKYMEQFQ